MATERNGDFQGKAALVTGASRGIGAAIARELARRGCDVAIAARSREPLDGVAAEIRAAGGRALAHAADLRDPAAPAAFVEAAASAFGRLDIVVCNAGATPRGDFLALTDEDWADGYALKLFAHVRLLRAAWPHLRAAGGNAVIVAGVGGRTPGSEFAVGGSVNAALLALTKALAEKGTADGIRVNAINPGPVRTGRLTRRIAALAASLGIDEADAARRMVGDLGVMRFGEPEDVAGLVAFVASEEHGHFLQGSLIDMDGGQTKTI